MKQRRSCTSHCLMWLLSLALALAAPAVISAQEHLGITEITPRVLVFSTSAGNVVASVGPDGALLVGIPSADSTAVIARTLAARTQSPVRYVVIFPEAAARSEGDAGWGRRGGFVAMQENALGRMGM